MVTFFLFFFFFNDPATTEIYTLSLHDALPISGNDGINLPLSQKRAEAVYNYLASCGVTSRQVKNVQGFGSAKIGRAHV